MNASIKTEQIVEIRDNAGNLCGTYHPIFNSAENPYAHAPKNLELFKEFNALAVLLAAIEILGGEANG